jgi:hypothetical protein
LALINLPMREPILPAIDRRSPIAILSKVSKTGAGMVVLI